MFWTLESREPKTVHVSEVVCVFCVSLRNNGSITQVAAAKQAIKKFFSLKCYVLMTEVFGLLSIFPLAIFMA